MSWTCLLDYRSEMEEKSLQSSNWWQERDARISGLRRDFLFSHDFANKRTQKWKNLVLEYTGRVLSNSKDRMVAISGIATAFGERAHDRYLAGLWLQDFPFALLRWIANDVTTRPIDYLAPSWSWRFVDGTVRWMEYPA
jgi:hypothetical protein